jgi:prepilin-type N-terminal cleavage/methylation domain-containing protein
VRRDAGFTLVEVTLAAAVLSVVVVGIIGTMTLGMEQSALAADTALAVDAARRQAELMASKPFSQIFALFDDVAWDDPGGAGTGFTPHFAVAGLAATNADGFAGHVIFPSPAGTGTLREDTSNASLGMPRDLDGDGTVGSTDVSHSYKLLPAQIRVDWQGTYGAQSYSLFVLFNDRTGGT